MKILGIIGGIAPASTVEYYRLLVAGWKQRMPGYPPVLIDSIDLDRVLGMVSSQAFDALTDYLLDEIQRLSRAGAHLALLASNTPHIVFDSLRERSPIPLISIVEATCTAVRALGLKRPGLIGTRFTMQGSFYPEVYSRHGISLLTPNEADQAYIHDKYIGELANGVFLTETRDRMLGIAARMRKELGMDGLILGGTELPLLLRAEAHEGIPLLDTTRIHVEDALSRLLS
ncbi:MAG TPA: amino acid racemase [Burkholderiales bacterium]|nr:amino acid racemase [Burkholderiales bacterium]